MRLYGSMWCSIVSIIWRFVRRLMSFAWYLIRRLLSLARSDLAVS